MFHLVEQRVRRDLPVPLEFHDRLQALAAFHGSIRKYGLELCACHVLSDRVLLAVIPAYPHAIGLALTNASQNFARRFNEIHGRVAPVWQGRYGCCPFAKEVAWPVLRYVDLASVPTDGGGPFDPRALGSAAEHAGVVAHGLLTAPLGRLPNPLIWRAYLESPQDERLVQALELCLRTGKPFGPFPFVRKVEQACGRRIRPACLNWPGLFDDVPTYRAGVDSSQSAD
jgi:hypothetical protein